MSRIQAQAAKLWQIIRAPETFSAYKSAVVVTWDILREIFLLLWLSLMWVAVLADGSITLGRSARTWLERQKHPSSDRSVAEVGKALLSAGSKGLASAISQAKHQLGIPVALETKVEPTVPVADSEPVASETKAEPTMPAANSEPTASETKAEPAVPAANSEPVVSENGGGQPKQPSRLPS